MRLLDLFCGAGGAAMGYHRAGFKVTGVDIKPQPHYPFAFVRADALEYVAEHGAEFDVIHASPPCQGYSSLNALHKKDYPKLIGVVRDEFIKIGANYVIENVYGARKYLINPIMLCGTMFGLGVGDSDLWRHRCFEIYPYSILVPQCNHHSSKVIGVYGGHGRDRRVISVIGHTGGKSTRQATNGFTKNQRNEAMGIDWMTQQELSQAIPPAYTEFIGRELLRML